MMMTTMMATAMAMAMAMTVMTPTAVMMIMMMMMMTMMVLLLRAAYLDSLAGDWRRASNTITAITAIPLKATAMTR